MSAKLDGIREAYDEVLIRRIAATGSYVAAMPYLKAWFELLGGLCAGPVRPPSKPGCRLRNGNCCNSSLWPQGGPFDARRDPRRRRLGTVLGGYLANAGGVDVTLVGRRAHAEAIARNGLHITGRRGGELLIRDNVQAVDEAGKVTGPVDYLVLAVKGKDTAQALADAAPLRDVIGTVLSVQNSVEKDATLANWLGRDRVIGASTIEGGTLVAPGVVRNHLSAKVTAYFGELDGSSSARVDMLTAAFNAAGLPAAAVGNIEQVEWEKLAQIALAAAWSVTALGAIRGARSSRAWRCLRERRTSSRWRKTFWRSIGQRDTSR